MYIMTIILIAVFVSIDQLTKYIAIETLKPKGSINIIDNIFSFTFVENRGAAFGIFQGKTTILSLITVIIIIAIVYFYIKLPKGTIYTWIRFSLVLVVSGALGNLIDRLKQGYVVDFLHATFINFPVFNVADMYVVIGAILMAVLIIFFIKEEDENK